MKICIIELIATRADSILGDERLANLRRLMDFGLYGRLQSPLNGAAISSSALTALWQPLAGACQQAVFMRAPELSRPESPNPAGASPNSSSEIASPSKQWTLLIDQLMNPSWDYIHFVDHPPDLAPYPETQHSLRLDEQIGRVLEMLDDQTALLVIGGLQPQPPSSGFFLLAAPTCPISGEFQTACLADLAPTLLELAGRPTPEGLPGRSLIDGLEKRVLNQASVDHDRIVLDRLAGLGYV